MNAYVMKDESAGMFTGFASLLASMVAGLACIGPLMGIALGISGLGSLTQYSNLTVPASIISLALLSVALYMFKARKVCCADKRKHLIKRNMLALSALLVIGINVGEFLIIPYVL